MSSELVALLGGRDVGRIRRDGRGKLTLTYESSWRDAPDAYPLSLSMPLVAQEHGAAVVEAFLWGLLPDNEMVLQRWGAKFQVSPRNAFALIGHVGEDCAGAVQFVRSDRLDDLLKGKENETEWLNERELAERLHILRNDHTAWRLQSDTGQFSLAGAQPKTALLYDKGRWGIPSGRTPTTHILKPPTGTFDGHAENEHICLALARAVGLPAANSQVLRFEKEIAIAVERYDRQRSGKKILRVHQEDMCQSLGIMPTRKYQNEGGPGIPSIVELLRTHSSAREEDVNTFVGAVGFNWLIAGTDAHAKNYSVLIADGSRVRLAPLYDVASILPYDEMDLRAAKLAMKIGDEYLLTYIGLREWQKLARQTRVNADELIIRLREMASQLPDEINSVRKQAHTDGLARAIVDRMAARLVDRAKACQRKLANGEQ